MDKYESKHNKLGEKIAALVAAIYNQSILEFCQTAELSNYDGEGYFSFDDMPLTKALANKLTKTVASNIQATIVNGCTASWNIAEQKNDALVNSLFKGETLTDEQKILYFQNNEPALKAFINRRTNGMRLSDRVWKYTNDYKNEIEDAISVSIGEGKSAHSLAKEVQQYLQQPDKLFRRVRDEKGNLHLSNNAKNYHPGRGVYRSSYQNAKRLARTEINMAYRTADNTRIQQFDFVVGIEIKTSGNHPEHDICDQLAGRYPKDFKFTGWHPNCRCYTKTILKTEEEMDKDEERMRKGKEPTANSVNTVSDVPDNFKDWVEENEDTIERAKSKPYFISDNKQVVDNILKTNADSIYSKGNEVVRSLTTNSGTKLIPNKNINAEIAELDEIDRYLREKGILPKTASVIGVAKDYLYMGTNENWKIVVNFADDIDNNFNAGKSFVSAMKKLIKGKPLDNFDEEYSIECFWHELLHNYSKNTVILPQIIEKGGRDRIFMETVNQLVARNTYQEFLENFGVKPKFQNNILANGFGYQITVNNLRDVLKYTKIDESKFVENARELLNDSYENFENKIKQLAISMSGNPFVVHLFDVIERLN